MRQQSRCSNVGIQAAFAPNSNKSEFRINCSSELTGSACLALRKGVIGLRMWLFRLSCA